jgi:hypothetical protein
MADDWVGFIGVWIAVGTGVVTGCATLYGLYREWIGFRQRQAERLRDTAIVAVRRTEASYVRPLLRERLAATVGTFVTERGDLDALRFRALLFRDLHCGMRLDEDEKRVAQGTAVNHLVGLLRGMPHTPLRVSTDEEVRRAERTLRELVETAYSIRPRPSVDMLQQFAHFCGSPTPSCS